ncbi:YbjQ family protein [Candidatus Micrarchaeota archaeon]|nr:YbjQ family protein [Candidatus Micrarchaeota archaeon]MBI5177456.1 YbjQ family protein [Candidatus Micrarchaeota archaeon]
MASSQVLVSTTDSIPGYRAVSYRGIAWASSARSKNALADLGAVLKTIVGGEIRTYKKMLNEARASALSELMRNAHKEGANAVVGVRFSSAQLISSTVEVTAYGTAVVVERESGRK